MDKVKLCPINSSKLAMREGLGDYFLIFCFYGKHSVGGWSLSAIDSQN